MSNAILNVIYIYELLYLFCFIFFVSRHCILYIAVVGGSNARTVGYVTFHLILELSGEKKGVQENDNYYSLPRLRLEFTPRYNEIQQQPRGL